MPVGYLSGGSRKTLEEELQEIWNELFGCSRQMCGHPADSHTLDAEDGEIFCLQCGEVCADQDDIVIRRGAVE